MSVPVEGGVYVGPVLWDERLATGDPKIDAQHAELHDLTMELGMLAASEPDRVRLGEVMFDVLSYWAVHRSDEEELMRRVGFPELERHGELHAAFAQELAQIAESFTAGDPTVTAASLHDRLQAWVLDHIWKEDLRLAAYIQPRGN